VSDAVLKKDRTAAVSLALVATFLAASTASSEDVVRPAACGEALAFTTHTLVDKKQVNLCETYGGQVVLIVNTASKCAFTPQYEGLETMYRKYQARGFVVLGFPSADFANQEYKGEKQIQEFCRLTYGVQFPMFEKTRVAEHQAGPMYRKLAQLSGQYPQWNFHKYLIDRNGKLVGSFASGIPPEDPKLVNAIEALL
jgi:glutathione peroxidase